MHVCMCVGVCIYMCLLAFSQLQEHVTRFENVEDQVSELFDDRVYCWHLMAGCGCLVVCFSQAVGLCAWVGCASILPSCQLQCLVPSP